MGGRAVRGITGGKENEGEQSGGLLLVGGRAVRRVVTDGRESSEEGCYWWEGE